MSECKSSTSFALIKNESKLVQHLAFIILYFCLIFNIQGQNQLVATTGVVNDANGQPIPFALIYDSTQKYSTTSNQLGAFEISLPNGKHQLIAQYLGYKNDTITINTNSGLAANFQLKVDEIELDKIVVSASRSAQNVDQIAVPTKIITNETIKINGNIRLNEILEEQTGLQIYDDHGTGLQMQGLNSDYIMIAIDGEPVIGRTAGTLELDRITVNNIERIEIIKGPSSSLYGNEAMAGVVNIITKTPEIGWHANLGYKFRSFNTHDAFLSANYKKEKFGVQLDFNRLSSDGYNLNPDEIALTAPKYQNYTAKARFNVWLSKRSELILSTQGYFDYQQNQDTFLVEPNRAYVESNQDVHNSDSKIQFKQYLKKNTTLEIGNRFTHYNNVGSTSTLYNVEIFGTDFKQYFNRAYVQVNNKLKHNIELSHGVGFHYEKVNSTRYKSDDAFLRGYLFSQLDWNLKQQFFLTAGFRFDAHNVYKEQISPKLALRYKPTKWISIQASAGAGYKAPDFRQLLLNFTNASVGYTVFGNNLVVNSLAELDAAGGIQNYILPVDTIQPLRNESSWGFNGGVTLTPHKVIEIQTNVFRNQVTDLIETGVIARKTNNQNVFTYFNISKVVTQGLETNINIKPIDGLSIKLGYQFVDSKDLDAVERFKNGEIIGLDDNDNEIRLPLSRYGGLPSVSKHSATFNTTYNNKKHAFALSFRGIYRGKYGWGDNDGTGYIDNQGEYIDSYFILDFSVKKTFLNLLTLNFAIDNLINYTDAQYVPSLSGRRFMGGISFNLNNNNLKQLKQQKNEIN